MTYINLTQAGNASHHYSVISDFLQVPEHISLGYTHGIEVDQFNNVYIFHTGSPSILKFNPEGQFLSAWGEQFEGGAHGFYLHRAGNESNLYVTDIARGIVVKMTMEGVPLLTIGTPERPDIYNEHHTFMPTDVAVAPNGDIYIADGYGQPWIHQFTAEGALVRSWGGSGDEPGKLNCPHGVSVNLRGDEPEIYVADRGNHRIQIFTTDGSLKRIVVDDVDMPCSFYFHKDEMYVPDLNSRVSVYDRNDRLVAHLGEDQQAYKQKGWPNLPKAYYRPNKFSSPHGVCVNSEGSVFVAEWIEDGRVTKLVRSTL